MHISWTCLYNRDTCNDPITFIELFGMILDDQNGYIRSFKL
ncbi:hypothetical protein Hanom_Chr05g00469141 [Helianthus anomalus]